MASSGITRLGGRPVGHQGIPDNVEAEYDRLRDLARKEAKARNAAFEESKAAYKARQGARAKELSDKGKKHAAKMREYNQQASEYIFRENNAFGRIESDCIDLHGQFVEEAEEILEKRIRADMAAGQTHLHAIVGRGNHSSGHVQKIKPKVEELCQEMGLRCETEDNEGRIYIDLTGGKQPHKPQQQKPQKPQKPYQPQTPYQPDQGRPPRHDYRPPQSQPQRPPKEEDEDLFSLLFRKVREACCIVM